MVGRVVLKVRECAGWMDEGRLGVLCCVNAVVPSARVLEARRVKGRTRYRRGDSVREDVIAVVNFRGLDLSENDQGIVAPCRGI